MNAKTKAAVEWGRERADFLTRDSDVAPTVLDRWVAANLRHLLAIVEASEVALNGADGPDVLELNRLLNEEEK